MSNADGEKEREEQALDALTASAFKEDLCDVDDEAIDRFGKLVSEADRAAIDDALGPNFIDSLLAGILKKRTEKTVRGELSTAMHRSEEEKPPTESAQAEMEQKIRAADEKRRAKEQQDKGGTDDAR